MLASYSYLMSTLCTLFWQNWLVMFQLIINAFTLLPSGVTIFASIAIIQKALSILKRYLNTYKVKVHLWISEFASELNIEELNGRHLKGLNAVLNDLGKQRT